jgi:flagellar protein FliS
MSEGEIERAHTTLRHGERIISHLDATLDFDQGDIAQHLHSIYVFCLKDLHAARMHQDSSKVEAVSELLGELREAWDQVVAEVERGSEVGAA